MLISIPKKKYEKFLKWLRWLKKKKKDSKNGDNSPQRSKVDDDRKARKRFRKYEGRRTFENIASNTQPVRKKRHHNPNRFGFDPRQHGPEIN